MVLDSIKAEVASLTLEERKLLIHFLVESLTEGTSDKMYDALEFEGVGAHLRDDSIDTQEYVNQLRSEWDHRL